MASHASYVSEPDTQGKIILSTNVGELSIELWSNESPIATRFFLQNCLDGLYDNSIFYPGDAIVTLNPDVSVKPCSYPKPEAHSRLRFTRRGLIAIDSSIIPDKPVDPKRPFDHYDIRHSHGKVIMTLSETPWLKQPYQTIIGCIVGDTIYNLHKFNELDKDDGKFLMDVSVKNVRILSNPFPDMISNKKEKKEENVKKPKKKGVSNSALLSFDDDDVVVSKKRKTFDMTFSATNKDDEREEKKRKKEKKAKILDEYVIKPKDNIKLIDSNITYSSISNSNPNTNTSSPSNHVNDEKIAKPLETNMKSFIAQQSSIPQQKKKYMKRGQKSDDSKNDAKLVLTQLQRFEIMDKDTNTDGGNDVSNSDKITAVDESDFIDIRNHRFKAKPSKDLDQ